MLEKPKFLQGTFPFQGKGLATPVPMQPAVAYKVPTDKRSTLTYFRAGNGSGEMIYFLIKRDGAPMRYFPLGAKGAVHIPLAVTEDLHPETVLELFIAAPEGVSGQVVVDVGLVEF